ncbi:MAG: hypothetical protein ACMUJM_11565 [bacterium]
MAQTNENYTFYLEQPRRLDKAYQKDRAKYASEIKQLQHILSVRADKALKKILRSTKVIITNRGRAEAFTNRNTIYFDMALLDLVEHFAEELSAAEAKNDPYHQMEFNLAYAAALNDNKKLSLLDVRNTAKYTYDQNVFLWHIKERAKKVIFKNILGFILAHEASHLKLDHENIVNREFPAEKDRGIQNLKWNFRRREMELAADELAARICLNSLIQPAQLLPWLDLNQTRRRYYGKAAEYPTPAQRIAIIQKAYVDIVGNDEMGSNLTKLNPLPPHRDVLQNDYGLFLEEFRKVRAFRQSFLIEVDRMIASFINDKFANDEIATAIFVFIERQKDLLKGAKNQDALKQAIQLVSAAGEGKQLDVRQFKSLLEKAEIGSYELVLLQDELEKNPNDLSGIQDQLNILKGSPEQFLQAITYDYLLSNTLFRWYPDLFVAIQNKLPDIETKAKRLKPYRLDQPPYPPLSSYEQKLKVLREWNGKY